MWNKLFFIYFLHDIRKNGLNLIEWLIVIKAQLFKLKNLDFNNYRDRSYDNVVNMVGKIRRYKHK